MKLLGHNGTCLKSQHLGCRERQEVGSFRLELCNKTLSQKKKIRKEEGRQEGGQTLREGGKALGGRNGSNCESQAGRFKLPAQGCCFPA